MIEQNVFHIIFGIFLVFTCRDVLYSQSKADLASSKEPAITIEPSHAHHSNPNHHHNHHHHQDSDVHVGNMMGAPTVKIQFCQSCGYRQAFNNYVQLLQEKFPGIRVEGEIHKPHFLRSSLVNLVFMGKIALLAALIFNINPFAYLQMETPSLWTYATQKKMPVILMVILVANTIESSLMSTGAFEIFYNDMPVWSKIQEGRMPNNIEIVQAISSHGSFSTAGRKPVLMSGH